jgi:hypothetical protein
MVSPLRTLLIEDAIRKNKAFNLKSSFQFKSSAFSLAFFIVEKYFSWAVKTRMMMGMMLAPVVGHGMWPPRGMSDW